MAGKPYNIAPATPWTIRSVEGGNQRFWSIYAGDEVVGHVTRECVPTSNTTRLDSNPAIVRPSTDIVVATLKVSSTSPEPVRTHPTVCLSPRSTS